MDIRKVVAGLDLTSMDEALIQFTPHFLESFPEFQKLYFIHNIFMSIHEEVEASMDLEDENVKEAIANSLAKKIEAADYSHSLKKRMEIAIRNEDSSAKAIHQFVEKNEVDLIMMGKKIHYPGQGGSSLKVLRMAENVKNVLLVPESAPYKYRKLLVATDFSEGAATAAKRALEFAHLHNAEVFFLHVYRMPDAYFPFLPFDKLEKKKQAQLEQQMDEWTARVAKDSKVKYTHDIISAQDQSIGRSIQTIAARERVDMIFLGGKGKGQVTGFILGSQVHQLVHSTVDVPLWICR